jgi:spore maturation protein CgeB
VTRKHKIFYVGELREGGTCLDRMETLRQMGHDITPFDTTPYVAKGFRVLRSLAHRTNFGPPVWNLNKALQSRAKEVKQHALVWIDKGRWIFPETLEQLRVHTSARLVHYTPDPQLLHHRSRFFNACISHYDLLVTTKPYEVDLYREAGARDVLMVLQGFSSSSRELAVAKSRSGQFESDVCFIGHFERHYADRLQAVGRMGVRLKVWGPGWTRYARFHRWAYNYVAGNGIWDESYRRALASSKIALGLLSKRIPETTTTRTFEIPAMGVFMLAERTDDHLALFKEGIEAEFFGSDEELKDKIGFYLENQEARRRIAAAGRERCLRSGYCAENQIAKVLEYVDRLH